MFKNGVGDDKSIRRTGSASISDVYDERGGFRGRRAVGSSTLELDAGATAEERVPGGVAGDGVVGGDGRDAPIGPLTAVLSTVSYNTY